MTLSQGLSQPLTICERWVYFLFFFCHSVMVPKLRKTFKSATLEKGKNITWETFVVVSPLSPKKEKSERGDKKKKPPQRLPVLLCFMATWMPAVGYEGKEENMEYFFTGVVFTSNILTSSNKTKRTKGLCGGQGRRFVGVNDNTVAFFTTVKAYPFPPSVFLLLGWGVWLDGTYFHGLILWQGVTGETE